MNQDVGELEVSWYNPGSGSKSQTLQEASEPGTAYATGFWLRKINT